MRRVNILKWTGATGDEYFAFSCPLCGWISYPLFSAADCFELHCEQCESQAGGQRRRDDLLNNCGAEFLTPAELETAAQVARAAGVVA